MREYTCYLEGREGVSCDSSAAQQLPLWGGAVPALSNRTAWILSGQPRLAWRPGNTALNLPNEAAASPSSSRARQHQFGELAAMLPQTETGGQGDGLSQQARQLQQVHWQHRLMFNKANVNKYQLLPIS